MTDTQDREAVERAAAAIYDAAFGQELPEAPLDLADAALSAAGWDELVAERDRLRALVGPSRESEAVHAALADLDRLRAGIEALAAEGYHADTCGSVLSPGSDYPCSCWKADLRALLSGTGQPDECVCGAPMGSQECSLRAHTRGPRSAPVVPDRLEVAARAYQHSTSAQGSRPEVENAPAVDDGAASEEPAPEHTLSTTKVALTVLAQLSEASRDGRLRDQIAAVRSALWDEIDGGAHPVGEEKSDG